MTVGRPEAERLRTAPQAAGLLVTSVGYLGGAFLESPGNAFDGIDNDGDGTDGPGPALTEADFAARTLNAGDNIVLIGDAKATAHFSIGSGTKLAMEDAIALYEAFRLTGGHDVSAALSHYETARREEVEKTQHAADVSLVWFEHVDRFWDTDPQRFMFGLMTRSMAIT